MIFTVILKISTLLAALTAVGREFQILAPAYSKHFFLNSYFGKGKDN